MTTSLFHTIDVGTDKVNMKKSIFKFDDCRFEVPAKVDGVKGTKAILKGISGEAVSGEVLAIMGPSGAGKTMLLNLLTLEPGPGAVAGSVTLNGETLNREMFERHAAVVTQVDRHWAFLTCRETIALSADLYMADSTKEQRQTETTAMLKRMGLEVCADTKVGNQFLQGLSGGQKRRLSLAVCLMKRPKLVFLDEPTSGLDAAAAASIMAFLKELSSALNLITVCTIHQPSANVFDGFSRCLVLSDGRTGYYGSASKLTTYLDSVGRPLPSNMGIAEHVLDLVNREFTDPDDVDKLLDGWESYAQDHFLDSKAIVSDETEEYPQLTAAHTSDFFSQTLTLVRRHALLIVRDPTTYLGRFIAFIFANIFFSVVYLDSRERDQETAQYKMFLIMWHLGVPTSLAVAAVYSFNGEFHAIKKEIKDGMYSPGAYLTATGLLQLPLMIALGVAAISIGPYCISNYHAPNYFLYLIIYSVTLWSFETMAQFFSVVVSNPLVGMLGFMQCWFASFLFAGIMVPEDDVVWPLKIMVWIFPYRWALSGMAYIDYKDTTWSGAILDATDPRGFSCPENEAMLPPLPCYGYTGTQVLTTMGNSLYKSMSPDNDLGMQIGLIALIAFVYKVQYIAVLYMKTRASRVPEPAKKTN